MCTPNNLKIAYLFNEQKYVYTSIEEVRVCYLKWLKEMEE